ncbi:LysE family transporter [Bacillus sp. AGMB 02131]|uniref:LysE family transporter n=1 Tax=Peribacillus faecalis TaxID=2772559 RepID=A0A927CUJ2_9BACI|nr:LysE family transporter [Peribacillus faecalis]MBD3107449.1 LysE family transporter [Peribacillus faecalis]
MAVFVTYLVLGFSLALPVGPITVEMTKQGLKNGFVHGWSVGLGGMTIDVLLIIFIYFGFSTILSQPEIKVAMWLIGAIFLLVIAIDSIRNAGQDIAVGEGKMAKSKRSSYMTGFLVGISPGNILFWVGIFGTVLANSVHTAHSSFLIVAGGILTGILLHDISLLTMVALTRKYMSQLFIKRITIGAGIVLIGFAVYFVLEFVVGLMKMIY